VLTDGNGKDAKTFIVCCLHCLGAEIPSVDQIHIFCHFCENWVIMYHV